MAATKYNPAKRPSPGAIFDTRKETIRRLNTDKPVQASVPDPDAPAETFMGQLLERYGSKLSKDVAGRVLKSHGHDITDPEVLKELGNRAVYSTRKIVNWLGY